MSEIVPRDRVDYLLAELGKAQYEERDLTEAAQDVMTELGWTGEQYAHAVTLLVESEALKASIQKDHAGSGTTIGDTFVYNLKITGTGWGMIEQLLTQEDPGG